MEKKIMLFAFLGIASGIEVRATQADGFEMVGHADVPSIQKQTFLQELGGEVKDASMFARLEIEKALRQEMDKQRTAFKNQLDDFKRQVLAMVIIFLREELPKMVSALLKSGVNSTTGWVKSWFTRAPQQTSVAEPSNPERYLQPQQQAAPQDIQAQAPNGGYEGNGNFPQPMVVDDYDMFD